MSELSEKLTSHSHRTMSRQVMPILSFMAVLVTASLLCLADDCGSLLGGVFGGGRMLGVCAFLALFHAVFIAPVLLQMPFSKRGKASHYDRRRSLRIAAATAVWQAALLAPFTALAVRIIPAGPETMVRIILLVGFHGMGAVLAAITLGRAYAFAAAAFSTVGPFLAFVIRDMGGETPIWMAVLSPFGQLAALTGFFKHWPEHQHPVLWPGLLLYVLLYLCAAVLRRGIKLKNDELS